MDIDDLNKQLKAIMELRNNKPLDDFEGRSPKEMYYLLHKTFDKDSPFQFVDDVDLKILDKIPILKMSIFFLEIIIKNGSVKLTQKGNLPVKIVKQIYDLKLFPNEFVDSGFSSIRSEQDDLFIHTMRIICEISKLIRKQNGKFLVTTKGKKLILKEHRFELFKELFISYTTIFNWAYIGRYDNNQVGQMGFAFSLELLKKYGNKELSASFYAKKYIKAFPVILEQIIEKSFWSVEEEATHCYTARTFYYFLRIFGLVDLRKEKKGSFSEKLFVKKSNIFDHVIKFVE